MPVGRSGKKKSQAPFFSQQFFIENHADIVSCVCMVICVGMMFQVSQPFSSMFVAAQYNITTNITEGEDKPPETLYLLGARDGFTVFFYTLIWITLHAVLHEYIWEKWCRRLHLSKTKTTEFYDSGQLAVYYLLSTIIGATVLQRRECFSSLSLLWRDYPDIPISFIEKMYYINQIAYWMHWFPELYLMKAKRHEIKDKVVFYTLSLAFILTHYSFSYIRLGIFFLTVHHLVECLNYTVQVLELAGKQQSAQPLHSAWSVVFVVARIATMTVAAAAFLFGLPKVDGNNLEVGFETGNFNIPVVRFPLFAAIIGISLYHTWDFVMFQINIRQDALEQKESMEKERQRQREKKKNRRDQDARRRKKEEEEETKASNESSTVGQSSPRKREGRK
ncbi:translocating chain-associated membrane protein 1-like 1 [Corticium candelabrum]|uniref:translocating chain-associated membrane protein 1-like 1 n=1 Tax=Corticium candelabrum TaxID=121492 RepID=UPI002E259261|nr:translocating chain-associated membrane protein 1-like 1 [Corticium candelabrum]